MSSEKIVALAVLLAAIAFAASPLFTTGFNGFDPQDFPRPQVDPPVQPAGYAFSIWGLIYAWLIAGSAYGFWRSADDPDWQPMRLPLLASLAIGTFWIAVANRAPIAATVMIWAMLALALVAFLRAGRRDVLWQVRPVALYAGWLTAASGVSLGVSLGGYGIMGEQAAALICLVLVLGIGLVVQAQRPAEWGYPAALIWALIGVVVANLAPLNVAVAGLAVLGIALFGWRMLAARR